MDKEVRYNFTGDTSSLANATDQAMSLLDSYEKKFQEVAAAGNIQVSDTTFKQYSKQIDRVQTQLLQVSDTLSKLEKADLSDVASDMFSGALDNLKEVFRIANENTSLNDVGVKLIGAMLGNASDKLASLNRNLEQTATLGDRAAGATDQIISPEVATSLDSASIAADRLDGAVSSISSAAGLTSGKLNEIAGAAGSLGRAASAASSSSERLDGAVAGVASAADAAADGMSKEASAADNLDEAFEEAADSMDNVSSSAKRAGRDVGAASEAMLSMLGKLGGKFAGAAIAPFESAGKAVKKLFEPMKRAGRLLMYTIGRLLRYKLVAAIFKDVSTALKDFAAVNNRVKDIMDRSNSAIKNMTANIAAALVGALQAVLPLLEWFASKVIMVANALAYLFALLSGASSYFKASTDAMYEFDSATGGSADSAERLEKALAGIDELNILDNTEGSGGGGGGGFGGNLEEVPVEPWDFFTRLKEFIDNADWDGLGSFLAEKVNEMIEKGLNLDWPKIQNTINGWIEAFTLVLNAFIREVDWKGLGELLGEGLNTLLDAFNTFVENFDFRSAGEALGKLINGIFERFDFAALGESISGWITGVLEYLIGLLDEIDWSSVGSSLATLINNIDFSEVMGALSEGISSAISGGLDLVSSFLETLDLSQLITDLKDGLVGAIERFDWNSVITALFEALGAAFATALQLGDEWVKLLTDPIGSLIELVVDGITTAAEEADFSDPAESTFDGFIKGLGEVFATIGRWVKEHIVDPFIEGYEKAMGISSPSTVMQRLGRDTIQGLINGLKEKIQEVIDAVLLIKDRVLEKFNELRLKLDETWLNIKTAVSTAWERIKTAATEKVEQMKSDIIEKYNQLSEGVREKLDSAKESISSGWSSVSSTVGSFLSGVYSTISTWASKIASAVSSVVFALADLMGLDYTMPDVPAASNAVAKGISKFQTTPMGTVKVPSTGKAQIGGNLQVPMAAGGVVMRPMSALIGEGKYKEAVIPLEDSPEMASLIKKVAEAALGTAKGDSNVDVKVVIGGTEWDTYVYESYERGKRSIGVRPIKVGV